MVLLNQIFRTVSNGSAYFALALVNSCRCVALAQSDGTILEAASRQVGVTFLLFSCSTLYKHVHHAKLPTNPSQCPHEGIGTSQGRITDSLHGNKARQSLTWKGVLYTELFPFAYYLKKTSSNYSHGIIDRNDAAFPLLLHKEA